VVVQIILGKVALDDDCLSRALLSNQQNSLALFSDRVNEEVSPHVVHVWNENTQIFRNRILGIRVLGNLRRRRKTVSETLVIPLQCFIIYDNNSSPNSGKTEQLLIQVSRLYTYCRISHK